jgi:CRP-like cAMP-binding protein
MFRCLDIVGMRKALFILGDLSDADIEWLAENAQRRDLREASVLVEQGRHSADVFIVLEGRFSVRIDGNTGAEINSLLPGEFVGELSFLDSRPASATVVASTPSVVAAIPRSVLSEKLERDLAFAARFYRALGVFLAHRLRRLTVKKESQGIGNPSRENDEVDDELDPELLESVALAAKRFDWIKSRLGHD